MKIASYNVENLFDRAKAVNDTRGIDVGLMTKTGYNIGIMRSHIHDLNGNGEPAFSRDCPEFCVETPDGEQVWILPNHFKSKFGGNDASSKEKRKAQATRTASIYKKLLAGGNKMWSSWAI